MALRGIGQRDPLIEYKSEAFALFEALLGRMRAGVIRKLMHFQVQEDPMPQLNAPALGQLRASHIDPLTGEDEFAQAGAQGAPSGYRGDGPVDPNNPATWGKVQRNAQCPCGSGRKFKHCHGALV